MKLLTRQVEKPWGRDALPARFAAAEGQRIGEIWFEDPSRPDLPLLPKLLFTRQRLSIQVHPSGEQAGVPGLKGIRAECWYVVEAGQDAQVGYGFERQVTAEEVQAAAVDGSMGALLSWYPVRPGDFIFVPSGVVHAIGANLTIVEFQQSFDVTYRLFDYGRGRPLQLEQALTVASLDRAHPANIVNDADDEDCILVSSPQFTVAKIRSTRGAGWMADRQRWVVPLSGTVIGDNAEAGFGECLLIGAGETLRLAAGSVALVAADGAFDDSTPGSAIA